MVGDASEHVGESGLRIDVVHFPRDDQGVHERGSVTATVGAGEQPGLPAERDTTQGPLGGIVGQADPAVLEEPGQSPLIPLAPSMNFLLIRDTPVGKAYVLGTFLTREVTDMGFKVASRVRGLSDEAFREGSAPRSSAARHCPGCAGRTASSAPPAAIAGIVCWRAGASTNATGARSRHPPRRARSSTPPSCR